MSRWARHPAAWIGLGVALTLALRAPWIHAALGRDEGGVAMIARAWHHSSPFPYGSYFLDRPPVLVLLYKLAGTPLGIRILGALAGAALVALCVLLAVRVGGRRAAPFAAVIAALMASSYALNSIFSPSELLAAVPSAACALLALTALERPSGGRRLLAASGACGMLALLVKQSFADALFAGLVGIAAAAIVTKMPRRDALLRAAAYLGGAAVPALAVVAWAQITQPPAGSIYYAMFGFRIDAASALVNNDIGSHLGHLVAPSLRSGLVLWLALAVAGMASLRERPVVRAVLFAWLLAGLAGVLAGGSYWAHYLIMLVPVTVAGAATMLSSRPRAGIVATAVIALPVLFIAVQSARSSQPEIFQRDGVLVGRYLRERAQPHQTAYVMYAKVNALYYSGLPSPFPYHWSLMMRAAPHAQDTLRALLASSRRPTWLVQWQHHRAFNQDRDGKTKLLIEAHYRRVATVCGRPVLLANGATAKPPPRPISCKGAKAGDLPF
ncbi:MAG: hypothetical protein QOF37_648 [Thermoleophilaceae bacterium]|nr:hypothetical protein [Thermoleophilaceae bacterium]